MRVKLLTSRVNSKGQPESRGETITVTDTEGNRLIAAGQAAFAEEAKPQQQTKPTKR